MLENTLAKWDKNVALKTVPRKTWKIKLNIQE
jgi:hypothetical protein